MNNTDEPVNWAGRKFGELTPDERRRAAAEAGRRLSEELTANADAISAVLDQPLDGDVPAFGGLSVSNVDRQPGKTVYWLTRKIGTQQHRWGCVIVRDGQERAYLNSRGENVAYQAARDQMDEAVSHYETWAASH